MECILKRTSICYEVMGEGTPIILLHGWGGDHRGMVDFIDPLFKQSNGWQRFYLDLPGFGRSPAPDWMINADKMLEILLEFIDTVLPGQRFAIYGISGGAYLALGIVYQRLNLINGLVLDVPVTEIDYAKRNCPPYATLIEDQTFISTLSTEDLEFLGSTVVKTRKVFQKIKSLFVPKEEFGDLAFQARTGENPGKYAYTFDVNALPEPLPSPALIITGRQDYMVGYKDAWNLLENYPRGTFVVLDRAGHELRMEQPELHSILMREWLDRVEEYINSL